MAARFFDPADMNRITQAVKSAEEKSSVEIVVSVQQRSDHYRDVDYLVGVVLAGLTLGGLIYAPAEFDDDLMPLWTLGAFLLGSMLMAVLWPLKSLLVSAKRRQARALETARARFVELGVSRTRDRTGMLVYVSTVEGELCLVSDIGIETGKLGEAWTQAYEAARKAVAAKDPEGFAKAIESFGNVLGVSHPRRDDDINELPDAPVMAMGAGQ
jgi:putative membrane protein